MVYANLFFTWYLCCWNLSRLLHEAEVNSFWQLHNIPYYEYPSVDMSALISINSGIVSSFWPLWAKHVWTILYMWKVSLGLWEMLWLSYPDFQGFLSLVVAKSLDLQPALENCSWEIGAASAELPGSYPFPNAFPTRGSWESMKVYKYQLPSL